MTIPVEKNSNDCLKDAGNRLKIYMMIPFGSCLGVFLTKTGRFGFETVLQVKLIWKRGWRMMNNEKKIQEMTRHEYTSYVQRHYRNDPQWVRTMLISKYDIEHKTKK